MGEFGRDRTPYIEVRKRKSVYPPRVKIGFFCHYVYSVPGGYFNGAVGDVDTVASPPGQQGMVGGQTGHFGVAGPVVVDVDQC